ncbi:MAG: hypothetical protein U0995_14085 [Erythrobacter sp.]|nr:hypothetical protein [Erythrobacter sp.]
MLNANLFRSLHEFYIQDQRNVGEDGAILASRIDKKFEVKTYGKIYVCDYRGSYRAERMFGEFRAAELDKIAAQQMVENGSLHMQSAEADYAQVRAGPSANPDAPPMQLGPARSD